MPNIQYPLDTTGLANINLITDELHTLTEVNNSTYRILIPKFAPFYLDNFEIKHTDSVGNTIVLIEGIDYHLCLPYIGATRSIGKMLYGAISINTAFLNGVLKITYQTLGGDWIADIDYVLEALSEHIYNPRTTVWDIVTNKTNTFPPINHDQSLDYVVGHQELINAINDLADIVAISPNPDPPIIRHLVDINNPHDTTKYQVGLGNVENLPLATDQEVLDLSPVDKYVTLKQLAEVGLFGLTPSDLINHLNDINNPHHATKEQIGLGNVSNISLATDTEVANKALLDKYVTLKQMVNLITNMTKNQVSRAELLYYSRSK